MLYFKIEDGKVHYSNQLDQPNDKIANLRSVGRNFLGIDSNVRKILTTDMDGVQIVDDNALDICELLGGERAVDYFKKVAELNIDAVESGDSSYCWYAPALFLSRMLQGIPSSVNREVGEILRLVPGAKENIDYLRSLGYEITNVTAGHQEAAEVVSRRLGIDSTIATQFSMDERGFYGDGIDRFVGGEFKLRETERILKIDGSWEGIHVGDSHSDIESMRENPFSIAWNPKYPEAVNCAKVIVFGTDKRVLNHLFSPGAENGETSHTTDVSREDFFPTAVYVNLDHLNGDAPKFEPELINQLVYFGNKMRKIIGNRVDKQMTRDDLFKGLERKIGADTLREMRSHIDSRWNEIAIPLDEFDVLARQKYKNLL